MAVAFLGQQGLGKTQENENSVLSVMAIAFAPGEGKVIEVGRSLQPLCLVDGEREDPEG